MKCDLTFLNGFRDKSGFDLEIADLSKGILDDTPSEEGVYVICSRNAKMIYPGGNSRILYMGMAKNLKRRIKEHFSNLQSAIDNLASDKPKWFFSRYNYMAEFGAHVYIYKCRGKQDPKNLESRLMWWFYNKYKANPVSNGARSFMRQ